MNGYGIRAEVQFRSNFLVGFAGDDMLQDFQFARRQSAHTLPPQILRAGHLRIEHGHAPRHALHRTHEIEIHGIFQNIAARTGIECLAHEGFLGMHAQHQDFRFRKFLQDFARGFDAAQLRHRAVHNDHLRPQFEGETHGLLAGAGFSDDGDFRVVLQHAAESAPDERVIVDKQHCDFMRHGLPLYPEGPQAARACRLVRGAIPPARRLSVRRVRAWLPARSLVAFFPPQSPCHDPPPRAPENSRKTSAGSTLRALRNAGSHYSALPAARDKRARLRPFPRGRTSPSSHSAASGPPGAPQWEYTSPECSPAPPPREELDAGLGKAFECCSMSIARSLVLLSTPREEAILPACDFQRGAT